MRDIETKIAKVKQSVLEDDYERAYEITFRFLYDLTRRLEVGSISDIDKVAENILDAIHFHDLKDF